jgi:hypothetical protein
MLSKCAMMVGDFMVLELKLPGEWEGDSLRIKRYGDKTFEGFPCCTFEGAKRMIIENMPDGIEKFIWWQES